MKTIKVKISKKMEQHLLNNTGCFDDSCCYVRSLMKRINSTLKRIKTLEGRA